MNLIRKRHNPTGKQVVSALREYVDTFDEEAVGFVEGWIDEYYEDPYAHAECIVDQVGSAMWRLMSNKGSLRLSYRGFNDARQALAEQFSQEVFWREKL